ncbi:hypothetical protein V496_05223 [Pseudogymnoascus sp. VKM F-4515 (FW-2607)]|nr:hypothetical protein V496_05223 [Pseudogymnoascus sp. VKM F-4515 (FW-2607)]
MLPTEKLYDCEDQLCKYDQYLSGLDEVIEHLRQKHQLSFIRRPQGLGISDSHGHVWYCFHCEDKTGKDHRSFGSSEDMWRHLNSCHNYNGELKKIKLEQ